MEGADLEGVYLVAIMCISYLIGSIPFSHLVAKRHGKDLSKEGSGNIGAMNVWRATKKIGPLLTALIGDVGKGVVVMAIAFGVSRIQHFSPSLTLWLFALAAAFVVIGHNWPVSLGFKGGKGLACLLGAVLFLNPGAGFAAVGVVIATVWLTEFVMTTMEFKEPMPRKAGFKGLFKKAFSVLGSQVLGRIIGIAGTLPIIWFCFGHQLFWIALGATIIALLKHVGRVRRYLSDLAVGV